MTRSIPPVGPARPLRLPAVADQSLPNGLRVLAVERRNVPVVELRLRIPHLPEGDAPAQLRKSRARGALLAETMLTGTDRRSRQDLAADLQGMGASLAVDVDNDRIALVGSVLAPQLGDLLRLVAEVLFAARYPQQEVEGERERLAQELTIALSQPARLAREALLARLYGRHPYGGELPEPSAVADVSPRALRALHSAALTSAGAVLTVVGDLDPAAAVDLVADVLGGWSGKPAPEVPPLAAAAEAAVHVVDRPGAVQTNVRLGGPALRRDDPRYPALQVANVAFGGYFSSRLVNNIREDKGYTYSPRSGIEHARAGSRLIVAADVATEVTGPALLEIWYELGRVALLPLSEEELAAARRYAAGSLALSVSTAAGLASMLSVLAGHGLDPEFLPRHAAALDQVSRDDIAEVADQFAPTRLTGVLLGDRSTIAEPVAGLVPLAG